MLTAEAARRGLILITTEAVTTASRLVTANPDTTKTALLAAAPEIVAYYSDGTAALAADHYDDLRAAADPPRRYVAEPVVNLRPEKVEVGVLWAVGPLYQEQPDLDLTLTRVSEVIQLETARPFRHTITTNTHRDPSAQGWRRIAEGGCKFCRMLAGRGAVYKADTARFASHPHCNCSAAPVFDGQPGPEADAMQYVASKRTRSPSEKQALRDFLAAMP